MSRAVRAHFPRPSVTRASQHSRRTGPIPRSHSAYYRSDRIARARRTTIARGSGSAEKPGVTRSPLLTGVLIAAILLASAL